MWLHGKIIAEAYFVVLGQERGGVNQGASSAPMAEYSRC